MSSTAASPWRSAPNTGTNRSHPAPWSWPRLRSRVTKSGRSASSVRPVWTIRGPWRPRMWWGNGSENGWGKAGAVGRRPDQGVTMAGIEGLSDLYGLLGVQPGASDDEIKKAYRARARELHPDNNPGDDVAEAKFKEVTLAYEVLRDPEKRARYDRFGPEGVFGNQGGGAGGFGFEGGLGDIFEAFFGQMSGGGGRRRGPVPGSDAEVRIGLELGEALFGGRKEISVRLPTTCAACAGGGAGPGTEPVTCVDCQGAGEVRRVRQSLLGQVVTSAPCPTCGGLGETIPSPCAECGGE